MKQEPEPMIVVGFGKHDLIDLIKKIDTDEEEMLLFAPSKKGWPPRYRRVSICTEEEIEAFRAYTSWIKAKLRM